MENSDQIRLHIGCGQVALGGWVNIDNQPLPGVDQVLDVTTGLPFTGVSHIFAEEVNDCFMLNNAFRGRGHQFLYNLETLGATLHAAGFAEVEISSYGNSRHAALQGLEKHETWIDDPDMPHVLVVEAHGVMKPMKSTLDRPLQDFMQATSAR